MPELPEAETVRAQLEPQIVGETILQTWARLPRITSPDIEAFVERTQSQKIVAAKRRGKQIYFPLESGDNLLVHLGMTGKLHVENVTTDELDIAKFAQTRSRRAALKRRQTLDFY